jgi:hypothetical protein
MTLTSRVAAGVSFRDDIQQSGCAASRPLVPEYQQLSILRPIPAEHQDSEAE